MLLSLGPDDEPCLLLIDLHAVRLGRPLDWVARRENLVVLNRWFILRAGRGDRLRFWKAYSAAAGILGPPLRGRGEEMDCIAPPPQQPCNESDTGIDCIACAHTHTLPVGPGEGRTLGLTLARDLEERTRRSNLGFWAARDGRCLRNNRYYRKVRSTVAAGNAVERPRSGGPGDVAR